MKITAGMIYGRGFATYAATEYAVRATVAAYAYRYWLRTGELNTDYAA